MSTLLDTVVAHDTSRREEASRNYRQLLARNTVPKSGDAERLRECMALLGLTAADVQADLTALSQHRHDQQQIIPDDRIAQLQAACRQARDASVQTRRELLHARIDKLDHQSLHHAFDSLCGFDTSAVEKAKEADARENTAAAASGNASAHNHSLRQEMAQAERDHPRVFGTNGTA